MHDRSYQPNFGGRIPHFTDRVHGECLAHPAMDFASLIQTRPGADCRLQCSMEVHRPPANIRRDHAARRETKADDPLGNATG